MDNWGREGAKNLRNIRSKNHASYPNITHVNPLYMSSIKNPEFNGNTSNRVKWQNLFSEKIKTVMQQQRLKYNANTEHLQADDPQCQPRWALRTS